MTVCSGLSKLKKLPRVRSVQFRHQTPGSVDFVINPSHAHHHKALDPDNPAWRQWSAKRSIFPTLSASSLLTLRFFPSGMLGRIIPYHLKAPFERPFTPWKDAVRARIADAQEHGTPLGLPAEQAVRDGHAHMSLMFASSVKRQGKRRYMRVSAMRVVKQAINLIVTRDARAGEVVRGRRELLLDEVQGQANADRWILAGWTYVLFTSVEMHAMSQADVVALIRPMLRKAWDIGAALEAEWMREDEEVQKTQSTVPRARPQIPRPEAKPSPRLSLKPRTKIPSSLDGKAEWTLEHTKALIEERRRSSR
ncbi:hypothetical protein BD626DRAFT_568832 [Schizophyllum amplum]|uniref:Uncharacterized protein n=1 Tax=Schizophyllum amplum TaxID=97359 RepID=A0A550CF44_9AGAR|nr:hypothetical protein BD626DRAFT_568832 [Auriculariopsis ampla]